MARAKVSKPTSATNGDQSSPAPSAGQPGGNGHTTSLQTGHPFESDAVILEPNGRALEQVAGGNNGSLPGGKTHAGDLAEKIKELVRLAHEQGYLTYGDINDALPD